LTGYDKVLIRKTTKMRLGDINEWQMPTTTTEAPTVGEPGV